MTNFFQTLESRTLFSVTTTDLSTDIATVIADGTALKASLNQLIVDNTTNDKVIVAAFKGLPKAQQILLKTLATDQTKSKALFEKELTALTKPSGSLAAKTVALGESLLKKATVKNLAAESKDIAALAAIAIVPAATLAAQLNSTLVDSARSAILAALQTDTAVVNAVTNEQTAATADKTAIGAAALKFATDISSLVTELTAVHTQTGTFPNFVGTFSGTAHERSGKDKGKSAAVTLTISSEDANGNLTGYVTDFTGGLDSLVGTISLNGVVLLKSAPHTGADKIAGVLSDATLSGIFGFDGGGGTYSVTEVTG